MLVAIVGLRVEVLKLGAGVGGQIQQATVLESSNSTLRTQISALSENQRIEKLAATYGMQMPNPLDVHLVQSATGTHVGAAIHNISAPSRTTFLSGLATEQHTNEPSTQTTAVLSGATTVNSTAGTNPATAGTNPATAGTNPATAGTNPATAGTTATSVTSTDTSAGALSTSSTADAGNSSTPAGGSADLNTGVTNTDPTSATSQTAGATGTGNGGTGLAG
ncbi:MAG: hypothetical protein ACRDLT_01445 [Solirubrobacteraceae bacterium]